MGASNFLFICALHVMTYLHQLVGVLAEHLGVLLHLLLVAALGRLDEHQQGNVGLQEGVRDVVHHRLPQLGTEERGVSGTKVQLFRCCVFIMTVRCV